MVANESEGRGAGPGGGSARETAADRAVRGGLRAARDRGGQALAEFTIVAPVLMLLIFGIIELAAAWRAYQVVTNSAREGARLAVVADGSTHEEVRRDIEERLRSGGLDPEDADVVIRCDAGMEETCFAESSRGESTEVEISYPYTFLFLRPVAVFVRDEGDFPGSVTMQTGIVMRNE